MKAAIALVKNVSLAIMVLAAAIDGAGVVKAEKGITLVFLHEDIDIIRIIKRLRNP